MGACEISRMYKIKTQILLTKIIILDIVSPWECNIQDRRKQFFERRPENSGRIIRVAVKEYFLRRRKTHRCQRLRQRLRRDWRFFEKEEENE